MSRSDYTLMNPQNTVPKCYFKPYYLLKTRYPNLVCVYETLGHPQIVPDLYYQGCY